MWRRLAADRRGVTAVEFGFVGMIFFVMLLGAVDLGRYQIASQSVRDFSAEAVRAAMIATNQAAATAAAAGQPIPAFDTSSGFASTIKAQVQGKTPFLVPARITLSFAAATSATGVRTVTANASYPFTLVAPLLPRNALTLTNGAALSF